jgi:hypothetical protein
MKPESPLTMEEILLLAGYRSHFKDEEVCSLVPIDKNDRRRPISIPQKPGPNGLSVRIMEGILFEARIDPIQYQGLLATVESQRKERQGAQMKNLK